MTENSQENEKKISFKEQILRDLAKAKSAASERDLASSSEEVEKPVVLESEQVTEVEETVIKPQEVEITSPEPEVVFESESEELEQEVSETFFQPAEEEELQETKEIEPVSVAPQPEVVEAPPVSPTPESDLELSRSTRKSSKKNRQNRVAGRIVTTVVSLLVVVLLATGFVGYNYYTSSLKPVDSQSTQFVTVEIPSGSGSKAIGKILEDAGLIKNSTIFNIYSKFRNYANFQSGYYNLQKSMDLDTIIKKLQEGGTETPQEPTLAKLTIPEGYTLTQIASAVEEATKGLNKQAITAGAFLDKVQDDQFIDQLSSKFTTLLATLPAKDSGVKYRLEGYLFPATYNITASTTVESLIDEMLGAMHTTLSPYYDQLTAKNLTVNDVLTLASLVEKEGSTDEDRKNIASVFYNRLNQGMPLQSNIAILYAENKLGQKTTLAEDAAINTDIDSPYNIYKNTGLMPGPVDSPSESAIEATVNPNKTSYLYFVANVETGAVYFADTYEEHSKNVQEHVNSKLNQ